jgi:urea transport system ATP-binding protein
MTLLQTTDLMAGYGQSIVLHGVSFAMKSHEAVAVVGKNGMSKSTFFKTLVGLLPVHSGRIEFMGQDITHMPVFERARLGMGYVPQGRLLFGQLTVEENLLTSLNTGRLKKIPDLVYDLFPVLSQMKDRKAGNLSGGQQQMVAIGRALTAGPSLLILDEPTEGIQPSIIKEIATSLIKLQQSTDCTVLLSEQVLSFAVNVADRLVVLERGAIVHTCGKEAEDVDAVKAFLTI